MPHPIGKGRPQHSELTREFEPTVETIRKWIKRAGLDEGLRSDGLTTGEHEELNRLRRENHVLREEREILANAAGSLRIPARCQAAFEFDVAGTLCNLCLRAGPKEFAH